MIAPVFRRILHANAVLVERALPLSGKLHVKKGDTVLPFDSMGECSFSHNHFLLPANFTPVKMPVEREFFYIGASLGRLGSKRIIAPYNGFLFQTQGKKYVFQESESKFNLLSGVWGTVENIRANYSVLLRTKTKDIVLSASTKNSISGELVVFPNPSPLVESDYLDKFVKNPMGKVVYLGNTAPIESLVHAQKLKVSAVLVGSCDKKVFNYAKAQNLCLGIISGFGNLATPPEVYKLLNVVAHRQVFLQGERNLLRIPMQDEVVAEVETSIKPVTTGATIISFQSTQFGRVGTVDSVAENSIFVRFDKEKELVEIKQSNFFLFN